MVDRFASAVVAEFGETDRVIAAARRIRELGYRRIEAYTPFRVGELDDALAIERTRIPYAAFAAGLAGAIGAYLVLWWTNAIDGPLDVGGRPYNSLPSHVPIVFETTVLFAAIVAFVLVLTLSGLPRLSDPVFELDGFERASVDRFWIVVDDATAGPADDVRAEALGVLVSELGRLGALSIRVPSRVASELSDGGPR